jgi:hypothetical protein
MLTFHAYLFVDVCRRVALLETLVDDNITKLGKVVMSEGTIAAATEIIADLENAASTIGLVMVPPQIVRVRECLSQKSVTYKELVPLVRPLRERIIDELAGKLFFFVPANHASYYQNEKLFGEEVEARFPLSVDDISEAGKCIAVGRFTAAVFHLMRVMEIGVQEFAAKLKVSVPAAKTWGAILREIDDKIATMPHRTKKQKETKIRFQELSAYLHHVKDVWRNTTMHPKNTYTEGARSRPDLRALPGR